MNSTKIKFLIRFTEIKNVNYFDTSNILQQNHYCILFDIEKIIFINDKMHISHS